MDINTDNGYYLLSNNLIQQVLRTSASHAGNRAGLEIYYKDIINQLEDQATAKGEAKPNLPCVSPFFEQLIQKSEADRKAIGEAFLSALAEKKAEPGIKNELPIMGDIALLEKVTTYILNNIQPSDNIKDIYNAVIIDVVKSAGMSEYSPEDFKIYLSDAEKQGKTEKEIAKIEEINYGRTQMVAGFSAQSYHWIGREVIAESFKSLLKADDTDRTAGLDQYIDKYTPSNERANISLADYFMENMDVNKLGKAAIEPRTLELFMGTSQHGVRWPKAHL